MTRAVEAAPAPDGRDPGSVAGRHDWVALRQAFAEATRAGFPKWITPDQAHFREQLAYALGRFDEGAALAPYFAKNRPASAEAHPGRVDVLDVGSGNGGVVAALANGRDFRVHSLDVVPNPHLLELRRRLGLPIRAVVGTGHALPFDGNRFDVVLLLDMLEHVPRPAELAREVMRVLRPGGACMITTLARLKYLFARDPHYGIRGLLLLPNAVQRQVVNRVFRRRVGAPGRAAPAYDVEHLFWSVDSIARLFPGPRSVEALYNRVLDGSARRFTSGWWRYTYRHLLWDRVLISKTG
jgi:SAM-dependent methyltransferase